MADKSLRKGQKLIWRMVNAQKSPRIQILAFIAFMLLFRLAMGTWSFALALILGVFLHELGHGLIFKRENIKYNLLLIFPLGAVAAPINEEEDKKSDKIHWYTMSWLLLAGITTNILLIFVGKVFELSANVQLMQFGSDLVYANILLVVMNILPVWTVDAGQLFHIIFSSMKERQDRLFALVTTIAVVGIAVSIVFVNYNGGEIWKVLINILENFGVLAFMAVFVAGIWSKQSLDDPEHSNSKQAMNKGQLTKVVAFYLILVVALRLLI